MKKAVKTVRGEVEDLVQSLNSAEMETQLGSVRQIVSLLSEQFLYFFNLLGQKQMVCLLIIFFCRSPRHASSRREMVSRSPLEQFYDGLHSK